MNDLRQASEQVLEAWDGGDIEWFKRVYTVMENLRAALAQQAEPVCTDCRGLGYDASGQLCACQQNPSF